MTGVLTEKSMPRRVPALNVLPLEQSSEKSPLRGHPPASQLDFLLSEDPMKYQLCWDVKNQITNQLGFARAGS
jgi:hypothetical protein